MSRVLAYFLLLAVAAVHAYRPPIGSYKGPRHANAKPPASNSRDLISRCKLKWRNTTLDHFTYASPEKGPGWFLQRYFFCDEHWRRDTNGQRGPIFFYVGNEADVTLYLNHTGLMWENAPHFGALLVFAEHRYYGASKPYCKGLHHHMGYLSAEQALADYAELLRDIKSSHPGAVASAVIGFGGSYGGMLAAWMRLKYPHVLAGAIAASAPIWNFLGEDPAYDDGSFAAGVTYDASAAAGSAPACVDNVRQAWKVLLELGSSSQGRTRLTRALRLCPSSAPTTPDDVLALREWLGAAWDYLAMGNFPYPSGYMLNGAGELPAYPVRVACGALAQEGMQGEELLGAMANAVGVFYNYSGTLECYDAGGGPNPESDEDSNFWEYQWCTEMFMPSSRSGVSDMFWSEPFNSSAAIEGCRQSWGVSPRNLLWADIQWGGRDIGAGSNIVFSNGLMDPWHGGGVLDTISDSLVAVIIPEGAHHLDLMFSHPLDPPSVKAARQLQLSHINSWIKQHAAAAAQRQHRQLPRRVGPRVTQV